MYWLYRGWEFATILLAAIGVGWILDNWLHTRPWFIIAFTVGGTIGGFIKINTMIKCWVEKNSPQEDDDD